MQIIKIMEHPVIGKAYLWQHGQMQYSLGTVSTTYMKFEGFLLEEILPKIEKKGFK